MIIGLLAECLNGFGHQGLNAEGRRRWEAAYGGHRRRSLVAAQLNASRESMPTLTQ